MSKANLVLIYPLLSALSIFKLFYNLNAQRKFILTTVILSLMMRIAGLVDKWNLFL